MATHLYSHIVLVFRHLTTDGMMVFRVFMMRLCKTRVSKRCTALLNCPLMSPENYE